MKLYDLFESPIADFGVFGDKEKEGSFAKHDVKMMNKPEWQVRVHKILQNTPYPFNLYIYNAPHGLIDFERRNQVKVNDLSNLHHYHGLLNKYDMQRIIGKKIENTEASI